MTASTFRLVLAVVAIVVALSYLWDMYSDYQRRTAAIEFCVNGDENMRAACVDQATRQRL